MMEDSSIKRLKGGGVMFAGPDATRLFQATVLRSALGLLAKGIAPRRGYTSKAAFAMAKTFTGQNYKRGEHARAMQDLHVWIETMKSAIPVEDEPKVTPEMRHGFGWKGSK